jgi:hypothetical protein
MEDLNRTLQTYPWLSGAISSDFAREIITNVGGDMVDSTATAENDKFRRRRKL